MKRILKLMNEFHAASGYEITVEFKDDGSGVVRSYLGNDWIFDFKDAGQLKVILHQRIEAYMQTKCLKGFQKGKQFIHELDNGKVIYKSETI